MADHQTTRPDWYLDRHPTIEYVQHLQHVPLSIGGLQSGFLSHGTNRVRMVITLEAAVENGASLPDLQDVADRILVALSMDTP